MDKARYIIVVNSYEYDDSNHYPVADDAYTLYQHKLYRKNIAEKICNELNEKYSFEIDDYDDPDTKIIIKPYHIIKVK